MLTATSIRQGGVRASSVAALGLTLRERGAVRAAHRLTTCKSGTPENIVVGCSCGWGTEIRGGSTAAGELFAEHQSGWMLHAADEKRRLASIELEMDRALEDGHALTRERFGMSLIAAHCIRCGLAHDGACATDEDVAEADGDVVSIARPVNPWRQNRPGAVAHLIKFHGKIAACGVEVSGAESMDARAYASKCTHCIGRA